MQALLTHTQPGNSIQVGPPFSPRHADKRMAKPRLKPSASRPRFAVSETLGAQPPACSGRSLQVPGPQARFSKAPVLQQGLHPSRGAGAAPGGCAASVGSGPCRSPGKGTAAGERPKCMVPALSDPPGGHDLSWVRTPAIRESIGKGKPLGMQVRPQPESEPGQTGFLRRAGQGTATHTEERPIGRPSCSHRGGKEADSEKPHG